MYRLRLYNLHTYMAKTNSLFNIFTIITTIESIVCMLGWKIETKENLRLREDAKSPRKEG